MEHKLEFIEGEDRYGDGLDNEWRCSCGETYGINDVGEAFRHGRETAQTGPRPLVVVGIYGGIPQWDVCLPGVGEPIFDLLDFDREGEDDPERREWLVYGREVEARLRERGAKEATALAESLDRMDPSRIS